MEPFLPVVQESCSYDDLIIDRKELYNLMGYGDHIPDDSILEMIDRMLNDLSTLCEPRYAFTVYPGKRMGRREIVIGNTMFEPDLIITSSTKEADFYALFMASIGNGFDKYLHNLQATDDMVGAFVAHHLGSALVEACGMVLRNDLESRMAQHGFRISNSYSPGYCDWKLIEQRKLFAFFPEGCCGIKLTESCLMMPIKSISGLIGVGEHVVKRNYSCDVCTNRNCFRNRAKRKTSQS